MTLDEPAAVRAEYASERRLAARKAAHRFGDGPDARRMGPEYSFHRDKGAALLGRHFARVERRDAHGWIVFPDGAAVREYVRASRSLMPGAEPPPYDGPLRVRRTPSVFVADRS